VDRNGYEFLSSAVTIPAAGIIGTPVAGIFNTYATTEAKSSSCYQNDSIRPTLYYYNYNSGVDCRLMPNKTITYLGASASGSLTLTEDQLELTDQVAAPPVKSFEVPSNFTSSYLYPYNDDGYQTLTTAGHQRYLSVSTEAPVNQRWDATLGTGTTKYSAYLHFLISDDCGYQERVVMRHSNQLIVPTTATIYYRSYNNYKNSVNNVECSNQHDIIYFYL
jgi:hypothetical protein